MVTNNQLFLTWAQIYSVLQNGELQLNDNALCTKPEAMEYANQAVREAEALIHTIYEDYFLRKAAANLTLVNGTDTYALQTVAPDLYAMKLRGFVYTNGSIIYPIKRLREYHKFIEYRLTRLYPTVTQKYKYFLSNASAGSPQIILSPVPQESGAYVEFWYIRRANEFTQDSDICDIPEFVQYIYDHVRTKVYEKEGHFQLEKALADKAATRQLMVETLTEMVPDHDNTIEADMSIYLEHS